MTSSTFFITYFFIGVAYWFINGAIRKLEGREDPFISTLWLLGWPLCFILLLIVFIQKNINKI